MEDLSLHIMDIVENSLRAGAKHIDIKLEENKDNHTLTLEISDDGSGMDEENLKNAANPYYTGKNGKRFGFGLSLLSQACEDAGGALKIEKGRKKGVKITAVFKTNNVDIKPLGNINRTLRVMRAANPRVHISYIHEVTPRPAG